MPALMLNGVNYSGAGGGGNANEQVLTWAEYCALTPEEKMNGTTYYINDINGDGQSFQPVIFSFEEREIGVWVDGKPLYQKTFYYSTLSPARSDWVLLETLSFSIDTLVKYNVMNQYTDGNKQLGEAYWKIGYFNSNNSLYYYTPELGSYIEDVYITLQYTKTTDQPGSGTWTPQGVPSIHYDGNEKVVGTWFGETLYEKTIIVNNPTESSSPTNLVSLTNENVIDLQGFLIVNDASNTRLYNNFFESSSYQLRMWQEGTYIKYRAAYGNIGLKQISATIRYTKSTS